MDTTTEPAATLAMIALDCADPEASAAFWSALLGWDIVHAEHDYAMLAGPAHALGFGRVEDYVPPGWPNRAVELGATVPEEQPGATWRVLLDPAGHPFCLTRAQNWG